MGIYVNLFFILNGIQWFIYMQILSIFFIFYIFFKLMAGFYQEAIDRFAANRHVDEFRNSRVRSNPCKTNITFDFSPIKQDSRG